MAAAIYILLKDPSLSEFLADHSTHAMVDSSWTCGESFSARLLDYVELFLKHSRAVDVEMLLDVLALHYNELLRVDHAKERRKVQAQLDWGAGLEFCLNALSEPSAPQAIQVGMALTLSLFMTAQSSPLESPAQSAAAF